jgi:hypothetical protein
MIQRINETGSVLWKHKQDKKKPLTKLTNKKKRPKLIKLEMKKEITDTSEIMRLIGEYF